MSIKALAIATIALLASFSMAKAQLFSAGLVTSDSNIETVGTVVSAYNFGGSNETVNGVNFVGTNNINGTFAGYTMNGPGIDGTGGGIVASPSGGLDTNLSLALQNVEAAGVHNASFNLALQLTGLTVGQTYSLQLLINANSHDARSQAFVDGAQTSPTVVTGGNGFGSTASTFGYNPAYITDVFQATSSTETLSAQFGGGSGAQLSGFVLESITVPEPGTWAMMGLGLLGLAIFGASRRAISRS